MTNHQHHHSLEIWRFYLLLSGRPFHCQFVKQLRQNVLEIWKENRFLPVDHPSTCWRTLKNSAICAANFVLYHETAGMYPIVFDTYYIRLLVIHRLVTPVMKWKKIHEFYVTLLLNCTVKTNGKKNKKIENKMNKVVKHWRVIK